MGRGAGSIGSREGGIANEAASNFRFPSEAGYFDRDFDYAQHERFKAVYLIATHGINDIFLSHDKAFRFWAPRLNIDYRGMFIVSENSEKAVISLVQTQIDLDIDGILFDGMDDMVAPIFGMCAEAGVAIWRCIDISRDTLNAYKYGETIIAGTLIYPNIRADGSRLSEDCMDRLLRWKEDAWPNISWERVGVIFYGYSAYEESFKQALAALARWCEKNPSLGVSGESLIENDNNFWFADLNTLGVLSVSQSTEERLLSQIVEDHSEIEVWLVPTSAGSLSISAASALDKLALTEKSCTASYTGSDDFARRLDAGTGGAWRYSEYHTSEMWTEPMICALWALMAGQCTPETLWPQWVKPWDKGDVFEFEGDKPRANVVNTLKLGSDGKPTVVEEHSYAQALYPT
ncbi:MAG: hypothetical protein FWH33_10520, partial [Oscillospiraceae bacterium]|nr:hypothetical protein [Oscillospiraceae bacterium]